MHSVTHSASQSLCLWCDGADEIAFKPATFLHSGLPTQPEVHPPLINYHIQDHCCNACLMLWKIKMLDRLHSESGILGLICRAPAGVLYLYKRYIAALEPIWKLYRSLIYYVVLYVPNRFKSMFTVFKGIMIFWGGGLADFVSFGSYIIPKDHL